MKKTQIEGFDSLPYSNSKFKSFFTSGKGIAEDLSKLFYKNKIKNSSFGDLPHTVFLGEDFLQVFSNDNLVNVVFQLDNHGNAKSVFGSISNINGEVQLSCNFAISENQDQDNFSVYYTRYQKNSSCFESSAGIENYDEKGLKSSLENRLFASTDDGVLFEARSTYGYYDNRDKFCEETLCIEFPDEFENSHTDLYAFRQELSDRNPRAYYYVDGKKPNLVKCGEIMKEIDKSFLDDNNDFLPQ